MTRRVSVKKAYLPPGTTFTSWLNQTSCNVFIGPGLNKYSQGVLPDSPWDPTVIFQKHEKKSYPTKLWFYEQYIRSEKMADIMSLVGMNLGCFCTPAQLCHGEILTRLAWEELAGIEDEFEASPSIETPKIEVQPATPPKRNPGCKRRLFVDEPIDIEDDDDGLTPNTKDAKARREFYMETLSM